MLRYAKFIVAPPMEFLKGVCARLGQEPIVWRLFTLFSLKLRNPNLVDGIWRNLLWRLS